MIKRIAQFLIWCIQKAVSMMRLNPLQVSVKLADIITELKNTLDEIQASLEDGKLNKQEISTLIGAFGKLIMALF